MAPQTRLQARPRTPEPENTETQYSTPKKSGFFKDYDRDRYIKPFTRICASSQISTRTGYRWLQSRRLYGSSAYRKTRQNSKILGRKSRVTKAKCKFLVSRRNKVRDQLLECQIAEHDIPLKKRALQTQLRKHTNYGMFYKMAYVKKEISPANKKKREDFGDEHKDKTVKDFWHLFFFTDEVHVDPSLMKTGYILREQGTRLDPDNIQEKPKKIGNKLHMAGWVNWHEKCEKLEFYHDEEEHIERPKRPRKPRKRKSESDEEFQDRLKEWDATAPHPVEVKPQGNSMTQKYYTDRLLPVYINAIQNASAREDLPWILQEDNDQSHGHRPPVGQTVSLAQKTREEAGIRTFIHPPQSPDLNPIEGCWCILKERMRKRKWDNLDELKQVLQDEWSKITMKEVRARIAEMPWRCKQVAKSGGKPIKSNLW